MRFIRKIRYDQDIDLVKHNGHLPTMQSGGVTGL